MTEVEKLNSIANAKILIKTILKQTLDNPNNPASLNFFQADTYRFYFLMSFMWEYLEGNEISQEYAISLVPKKYASRICLLYTSPSPRDLSSSRMPSSA